MDKDCKCTDLPQAKGRIPLLEIYNTNPSEHIPLMKDWSKRGTIMPSTFKEYFGKTINFQVREDDIFVIGMPKSGTTWIQEIAWLIANNFDIEASFKSVIYHRSIFLESPTIKKLSRKVDKESYDQLNETPSTTRRVIKTHLTPPLLPSEIWTKKPKIIYVAREVKDVMVSTFHHSSGCGYISLSKDEFIDSFTADVTAYGPYWEHLLDYWQMRHKSNVFFITYEEMKTNLKDVLSRLCVFLGKSFEDSDLEKLSKHLNFGNLTESKAGQALNGLFQKNSGNGNFKFLRRGISGSYKDELSEAQCKRIDAWSKESLLDSQYQKIFGML